MDLCILIFLFLVAVPIFYYQYVKSYLLNIYKHTKKYHVCQVFYDNFLSLNEIHKTQVLQKKLFLAVAGLQEWNKAGIMLKI